MSRCTRGKEQLASGRVMDGRERERATRARGFAIKAGRDRLSRAGECAPRGDCERGTIIIVLLRDASWSSQPRMPKAA